MGRHVALPNDRENVKEITVAILGNANSGKSSLVGLLTNQAFKPIASSLIASGLIASGIPRDCLDDGNGKSREPVMQYIHERKTGRTSSISYNYMELCGGYKIVSFVDLAGHEAYLKTTIKGVTSSYPDYGFVCIEKSVTRVTKEHLQILYILGVPFGLIMSKIDLIPEDKVKKTLKIIFRLLRSIKKTPFIVKSRADLDLVKSDVICPIFLMSNKSGVGFDKFVPFINAIPKKITKIPKAFVIDSVYTVQGFGVVVCGVAGIDVHKGDDLLLGPFSKGCGYEYVNVRVRTIHDDYRNFIDELRPNSRGCLCIKIDSKHKKNIRSGLVLVRNESDVSPRKKFNAKIHIFNGTSCTITPGYNAFLNAGVVKGCVKFNTVCESPELQYIRAGSTSIAELEFIKNVYCLTKGDVFLFREGGTVGYGEVL
jgi:elongation factor 1-alpha